MPVHGSPWTGLCLVSEINHRDLNEVLQHRVHVYEWNGEELDPVLGGCGLQVEDRVGLLSPPVEVTVAALGDRFGPGAARWYERLRATVPEALLDAVTATAIPQVAVEVLYVCRRAS